MFDELGLHKPINIAENTVHGFVFEVDKKQGDEALRNSQIKTTIVTTKNKIMTFT
jgi:hypothetical protein